MSIEVRLFGRLEFDEDEALSEALFQAAELLETIDEDLRSRLDHEGWVAVGPDWVSIDLDLDIPEDSWATIEAIVLCLSESASAGEVGCWHDGEQLNSYGSE